MGCAGIVLCGGESRRMGQPKATLPFGDEVMLERVLRVLGEVVDPRFVVAAPSQSLPILPPEVTLIRDRTEGRGPLEGLYCGLQAACAIAEVAYVTACDVPLLKPSFVSRIIDLLDTWDVVVPVEGAFHHPLSAVYRTRVSDTIRELLERNECRLISFYDRVATRRIDVAELRDVDPQLQSLMNVNSPEDHAAALRLAGLDPIA